MSRRYYACGLACLALACGGSSLPPARMADTQSSISAAAAVGADQNPQGALHLKMARDQLQEAQQLVNDGKDERARLVLERAQADAELALMLTREQAARAETHKAEQDVKRLSN